MTAREYLSQAYRLDQRINSKIEQLSTLNDLATKATSVMSGMPHNPNKGTSSFESIIVKIVDLQNEINSDIDSLVDLKAEITARINAVENTDYRLILERRYLCWATWPEIAVELNFSTRRMFQLHDLALEEIQKDLERVQ